MARITQKTKKKSEKSAERFHSLQLWWTVMVAIALGISYIVDHNRAEKFPKSAAQKRPLFERLPAQQSD
jgi:hypothetical protein